MGIPWLVFLTAFSFCPSAPLSRGLSPAKTHDAWFQDVMELRFLMSHWKKFSERGGFVRIQREAHSKSVGHHRGEWPWNVMWLFRGWVISYANELEDHSNNWGTTHSSVFGQWLGTVLVPLGVSFILQIEEQGLVEFDLSSWTPLDINRFMLCPCAMSFFQKLSPAPFLPVLCSSPEPCPGPQCCLYNILEGQPENSWPLGEKYYIISNPSQYLGLIFHVSYNQCHNSISQWTR